MKYINIDFETRSRVDLKKHGVYKYVEDPSTDVWCMAWWLGEEHHYAPEIWTPRPFLPNALYEELLRGTPIRAWNAQFERLIWNNICVPRYHFPILDAEIFYCTQADAFAMGLPGSLDKAAQALRLPVKKDMVGNRLAIQMSRPRKDGSWWDDKEKREQLYAYCIQDVRTEYAVMQATRRLGEYERKVYLLDQEINDRGVYIDLRLASKCRAIALTGTSRANAAVAKATGGDVDAITQVAKLQYWLNDQGCDIPDLAKSTVQQYLEQTSDPLVREVLLARAEAGKASVAKLDKMFDVACRDSRARGLLQYHAAHTGRWGGRLIQPQNLPRGEVKDVEHYIESILSDTLEYEVLNLHANPMAVVSSLLRSMLVAAPGKRLLSGDFSAIEARVLAWLAGQEDLVTAFAAGEDVYESTGTEFGTTRQCGKAIILGAGYGMGGDKFRTMGETAYGITFSDIAVPTGVDITERDAKWILTYPSPYGERVVELESYEDAIAHAFVRLYRNRYQKIPLFWQALENMMVAAVREPGSVQILRNLKASCRKRQLWLILPSKRPLCYNFPELVDIETPWGEIRQAIRFFATDSLTKKWRRHALYGGLIAENVVQAASRDLMVHSMIQAKENNYPVILTVHDEVVAEAPKGFGSFEEYQSLLERKPTWADGLPLKVSGWEGQRYRKD